VRDEERNLDTEIEGQGQEELMEFVAQTIDDPLSCHSELIEHIRQSDIMLAAPFNYYTFAVSLNIDEQIDIQNRNYVRFYKKKVADLLKDVDGYKAEIEISGAMIDDFKKASEKAERQIKKLEIQNAMFVEEKASMIKINQNRVKRLSNQFVETYKDLDTKYNKYKEFIIYEFEAWEAIKTGLEKIIQQKEDEIEELKDALAMPRKHYKFIDHLTAEEIVKQKGEIVKEMAENMGIPAETLLETLY
jgi:hypothetical protein